MGLTGGLGAVPGTIAGYPLDILKVRMQTTTTGTYRDAVRFVISGGHGGAGQAPGLAGFYRGLAPAVELRIIARTSQFLCAELSSQLVERYTAFRGAPSRFVGALGSGYAVGCIAGLAEYRKKLLSQAVCSRRQVAYGQIFKSALAAGQGRALLRRLHGAGCRSAVNDSCFFAMQYHLQHEKGWSAPSSYAGAAACGVVTAFFIDTAVSRMMLVPPWKSGPGVVVAARDVVRERGLGIAPPTEVVRHRNRLPVWARTIPNPPPVLTWQQTFKGIRGGYRGLIARAGEFGISYGCTGMVGAWLASIGYESVMDESHKGDCPGEWPSPTHGNCSTASLPWFE